MNKVSEDPFFFGQRKRLILQLMQKGITEQNVLDALLAVPRHLFMDKSQWHLAYEDRAQAISAGQTISQPYTVAFQTQLLATKPGEKVLEIGTGSGYQAAVLAAAGADVYSVERHALLSEKASAIIKLLGYKVNLLVEDGTLGWPQHAPYDKIIVTAAAPRLPKTLTAQLKNGGTMVIPYGTRNVQTMYSIHKSEKGSISVKQHGDFAFVPLIGENGYEQ